MVDYIVRPRVINLKSPGRIIQVDIAGTSFQILLTPMIEGVVAGANVEYTLVTLLQSPWYSYPFKLPLSEYIGEEYILEKLFNNDKSKTEEAKKLCYLLKKSNIQ